MRRSLELLRAQDTHVIGIFNSTVAFKVGDEQQVLDIEEARLIEEGGKIGITGSVIWKGKKIALDGKIDQHAGDNSLAGFELNIRDIPIALGSPPEVAPLINGNRVNPAHFELEASARLSLMGSAGDGDKPERLATELAIDDLDMQLGKVEDVRGVFALILSMRLEAVKSRSSHPACSSAVCRHSSTVLLDQSRKPKTIRAGLHIALRCSPLRRRACRRNRPIRRYPSQRG